MITTDQQIAAVRFSKRIASRIANDLPEIAGDYLEGKTYTQIIKQYDIMERYGIENVNTAKTALHYAMKRFFPEDFLEELAYQHVSNNGASLAEAGRGFFSHRARVRAGEEGARAKGYNIWTPKEIRLVSRRSKTKKYRTLGGRVRVRLIAEELGVNPQRVLNLLNKKLRK